MLPVVVGDAPTTKQILLYSILLLPISLLLVFPLHVMGGIYAAFAVYLGAVFIYKAWQLDKTPSDRTVARSVFKYSILYLMMLCIGMAIDSLPITHTAIAYIAQNLQNLQLGSA
jgi:heme o synthase